MILRYLSVCSGLEGATLAWHSLGWVPVGFAEVEKFPAAIIAHHYGSNMPGEPLSRNAPPNFGDFTAINTSALGEVEILVGGTPCQAFSVAGARRSLADARGNLSLAFTVLAHDLARTNGLRNVCWENVPGVLSTPDNAFGCFLGALVGADDALPLPRGVERWPDAGMVAGPRARAAWRILSAEYFGLAQRRARVFLVADFGTGADPAQVLFEPIGVQGNPSPRIEAREGIATTISARVKGGGGLGTDFDLDGGLITHSLRADGFDASEDGTGRGTPLVPICFDRRQIDIHGDLMNTIRAGGGAADIPCIAFSSKDDGADAQDDIAPTMRAMGHDTSHANAGGQLAVAFAENSRAELRLEGGNGATVGALKTGGGKPGQGYPAIVAPYGVRRLTPRECERLMGIPDNYTAIPWRGKPASECPDGNRYKVIGNSWAIPVVKWIGERIAAQIDLTAAGGGGIVAGSASGGDATPAPDA